MAKLMHEWTDRDYAQAAIDMLPGTVEEIDELMRAHGIKNKLAAFRSNTCPVAQWVSRWVGDSVMVGWLDVSAETFRVDYPESVRQYIIWADSQIKPYSF